MIAKKINAIKITPITDCKPINVGSELRVSVDGKPPKYTVKKIPQNIIPML